MPLVIRFVSKRAKYDPNIWNVIAPEWNTYWKPQFEALFASQATPPAAHA